jgi:16S rRNA (uracil1498-N3)-methyltransferase
LEPSRHLVLASAVIKSSRFDWVLEKGTELGVEAFIPLITRFTNVRLSGSSVPSRMERWRRIVLEASKQCRRFKVPKVHEPIEFDDFIASHTHRDYQKLMLYEKAAQPWPPPPLRAKSILLCIGPEGGWDLPEVEAARSAGFRTICLGSRILRVETAALAAVALVQFSSDLVDAAGEAVEHLKNS